MIKIFRRGVVLFGLAGLLFSCQSDNFDNYFENDAAKRIDLVKEEVRENLVSSKNGWKTTYFTNDKQLGGFTYLFKFNANGTVAMVSDFDKKGTDDPLVLKESEYDIRLLSSVGLVFTTGNYIHMLSNNSIFPVASLSGKGYLGDHQFLYINKEGDDLNFEASRSRVAVKFTPATTDDWEDIKFHNDTKNALNVKRNLVLIENGEETTFSFKFDRNKRWALILNADQTESVNGTGGVGIGFRKDGLVVSPAIEFEDGTSVSEFVKDGTTYVAQVGNNKVIIK